MDTAYWNLFWTTGMPEAWLMSRGEAGVPKSEARQAEAVPGGTAGPAEGFRFGQPGGFAAGPVS